MQFDTTLKELFHTFPYCLVEQLTGGRVVDWLTIEQPSVKIRRIDLVARLESGRILHIEIQAEDDPEMPWRMLEYNPPLRRTYGQEPWQIVLYIGSGKPKRAAYIREKRLRFSYEVVDIRRLDARPLFDSEALSDNLLALLCNVKDVRAASRRILQKLAALPEKQAKDAAFKLTILSKLRRAEKIVLQEVQTMLTITREDLLEWPGIAELVRSGEQDAEARGAKKGERKGERKAALTMLSSQLEARFGVLPAWAKKRLEAADVRQLQRWGVQMLEAISLQEALQ